MLSDCYPNINGLTLSGYYEEGSQINLPNAQIIQERNLINENQLKKIETKIKEKLNKPPEVDVRFIVDRLLRVCHLTKDKLGVGNNTDKVLEMVKRLELVGQVPQFDDEQPQMVAGEDAQNFIKFLVSDQPLSLALLSWKLVKALVFKKDETVLKEVRKGFQTYLIKLADKLNSPTYNGPHEQRLGEILIGNIFALYPFFEPKEGEIVEIPQKINDKWELVKYKITLLQMTPDWKGDPYFAYGFSPTEANQNYRSHLAFMGTPPPTTKGSVHAELTDFVPGRSVGETLYEEGKETIEAWVATQRQQTGQTTNVYGQSLGGSLCQILAAHKPGDIGEVFAYNPPSLWASLLHKYQDNVKQLNQEERPKINIFCQENDPIYSLGAGWDPSWNVYQVISEKAYNPYEAHIRAFSGHKVVVLKMTGDDIESHNTSVARRIYNIIAEILRVPFFAIKGLALGFQIIKHGQSKLISAIHERVILSLFGFKKVVLSPS